MANNLFKVKVILPEGDEIFIHRLGSVANFDKFKESLLQRYSIFKTNSFEITWIDAENDVIQVVNAEDFLIFSQLNGKKLFVCLSLWDGNHGVKDSENIKGGLEANPVVVPENAFQSNLNPKGNNEDTFSNKFQFPTKKQLIGDGKDIVVNIDFKDSAGINKNVYDLKGGLKIIADGRTMRIGSQNDNSEPAAEASSKSSLNSLDSHAKKIGKSSSETMASSNLKLPTENNNKQVALDTDQLSSFLSTLTLLDPKLTTQKSFKHKLRKCAECGFYKKNAENFSLSKLYSTYQFASRCTKCGGLKRCEGKENAMNISVVDSMQIPKASQTKPSTISTSLMPSNAALPSTATIASSASIPSSVTNPSNITQSSQKRIHDEKEVSWEKYFSGDSVPETVFFREIRSEKQEPSIRKTIAGEMKDKCSAWKDSQIKADSRHSETTKNANDEKKSRGAIPKLNGFRESFPKHHLYHANPKINEAVITMIAMGFDNDGNWLTKLLESVDGNIVQALELIHPKKNTN